MQNRPEEVIIGVLLLIAMIGFTLYYYQVLYLIPTVILCLIAFLSNFAIYKNYLLMRGFGYKIGKKRISYGRYFKSGLIASTVLILTPLFALISKIFLEDQRINLLNGFLFGLIIKAIIHLALLKRTITTKRDQKLKDPLCGNEQIVVGAIGEDEIVLDNKFGTEWIYLNRKALEGGLIIFGSIGTGKTQGAILPIIYQALKFKNSSFLIIDVKGSLKKILKKIYSPKFIFLSLGEKHKINPIWHPMMLKNNEFVKIAEALRISSKNTLQSTGDPFWELNAFNFIKFCLVICYLKYDYFTMWELRAIVPEINEDIISFLEQKSKGRNEEERFNIETVIPPLKEYLQMDSGIKTSIVASATIFFDLFLNYEVAQMLCPKKEDVTIWNIDNLIDSGAIIVTQFDEEIISKSVGTLFKCLYQNSVLNIMKSNRKKRDFFLIVDEYQDVASDGDIDYVSKSREAGGINIFATQSISALNKSFKNIHGTKTLINNFKSKIYLQATDTATVEDFLSSLGKEEINKETHSVSELNQNAQKNYLLNEFQANNANLTESISHTKQRECKIDSGDLARLKMFESFSYIFDGYKISFYKLFLKPSFLPIKTAHQKVLELIANPRAKVQWSKQ